MLEPRALLSAGALDLTFGVGGKVTTDIPGSMHDYGNAVVIAASQPDGKIIVVGQSSGDFALARYNTDGSLDTGFGAGGKVTTDFGPGRDVARAVAVQSDGKIVVAGYAYQGSTGDDFALARYNTDGSLDTSFGTGGKVTTDFVLSNNAALAVAVQSDGKIVVAGTSAEYQGRTTYDFALARYNTDGSLDSSFDTDGKVTTDFASGTDVAYAVAVQSDGKIVAAGGAGFQVARYTDSGALDTNFHTNGKLTTDFGGSAVAHGVALQSDGKIVVAGTSRQPFTGLDFALARYQGGDVRNSLPIANPGGPYVIYQGDALILNASASSDADGDPLAYSWDVNGDGIFGDAAGQTATLTRSQLNALGIRDNVPVDGSPTPLSLRIDDGNGGVSVASTTLTLLPASNLSISAQGPDEATAGSDLTYTITLVNKGPSTARNVAVTDVLPQGATFVSETHPDGWTSIDPPAGGAGSVTFTIPTVAVGASYTFEVTVAVDPAATWGTVLSNRVSVASSVAQDPDPSDNTSTITSTLRIPTSTAIVDSTQATWLGQPWVTLTVQVVPAGGGAPTGTVGIYDNGSWIGDAPLIPSSQGGGSVAVASISIGGGSHSITAAYNGDAAFARSGQSPAVTEVVARQETDVQLQVDPTSGRVWLVFHGSQAMRGYEIYSEGALWGEWRPLQGRYAGYSVTSRSYQDVSEQWSGASGPALSGRIDLGRLGTQDLWFTWWDADGQSYSPPVVYGLPTTMALTTSENTSLDGDPVTFTATVRAAAPATGTPTGSVEFVDLLADGTTVTIGTVGPEQFIGGQASFTTDSLGEGRHNIIAIYSGDWRFARSLSAISTPEVVTPGPPARMRGDDLIVRGTPGNDAIQFNRVGSSGDVEVVVNAQSQGVFHPTGRIMAFGQAGDDDIQVAGGIQLAAWLYGGAGNDRLKGGAGHDVLLGEDGDDLLVGGGGRDLLIGGGGSDRLVGNTDDDILIAGSTSFDSASGSAALTLREAALNAIMAEWTSSRSYAQRTANIRGTSSGPESLERLNGDFFLCNGDEFAGAVATVYDDNAKDTLTGSEGQDWFFANLFLDNGDDADLKDKITDLSAQEFALDLDFILSEVGV